jgi:hypothetical protein
VIRTKDWRTTWADFRNAWADVAFPAGDGPARRLMERAAAGPAPAAAADIPNPAARRLVAICAALQEAADRCGDRFFLSCRAAAAVCGFPGPNGYVMANRWLNRLISRGVLELVERGVRGAASRTASCYRFRHRQPDPGRVPARPDGPAGGTGGSRRDPANPGPTRLPARA